MYFTQYLVLGAKPSINDSMKLGRGGRAAHFSVTIYKIELTITRAHHQILSQLNNLILEVPMSRFQIWAWICKSWSQPHEVTINKFVNGTIPKTTYYLCFSDNLILKSDVNRLSFLFDDDLFSPLNFTEINFKRRPTTTRPVSCDFGSCPSI